MPLIPIFVTLVKYLLSGGVIKYVLFTILMLLSGLIIGWIVELMASCACSAAHVVEGLNSLFNQLPSGAWFFLDLFNVGAGIKIMFSAYVVRFVIRRLPVFG